MHTTGGIARTMFQLLLTLRTLEWIFKFYGLLSVRCIMQWQDHVAKWAPYFSHQKVQAQAQIFSPPSFYHATLVSHVPKRNENVFLLTPTKFTNPVSEAAKMKRSISRIQTTCIWQTLHSPYAFRFHALRVSNVFYSQSRKQYTDIEVDKNLCEYILKLFHV